MNVTIAPGALVGTVAAVPSKSEAHRQLICAALADKPTLLRCARESEDIAATVRCLTALGAQITKNATGYLILPLRREALPKTCTMDCGESGATLRFLLPVAGALGVTATFRMSGRLPQRPLYPLSRELALHGCRLLFCPEARLLRISGQLNAGDYVLPGNVSSQFISGLLFALPLLREHSWLTVTPPIESGRYVAMTLQSLGRYSIWPIREENGWKILSGVYTSPAIDTVEGDWSNAAFWLCAGALPGGRITVTGLNPDTAQGDRAVCRLLRQMGAAVEDAGGAVSVQEETRRGCTINAVEIPDLVPVLAAVAAVSQGDTQFTGAGRLRLKETNRLESIRAMLTALGGEVTELANGLLVRGKPALAGGTVDAMGDHRIAMSAAVLSAACEGSVTILGAQAVNKSYPDFWRDLRSLGKTVTVDVT